MHERLFVNPFRCCVWDEHARLEECLTAESCKSEIDSFISQGQLLPVLGRRLTGNTLYDVELIYGARRLFVARHLNVPLLVEICELPDREALLVLDAENCKRRDLSPYERGRAYLRWLHAAHFKSHDDIARALQISRSQVSRLLALARLPAVIVDAFSSPLEICETWATRLWAAWGDPGLKKSLTATARRIAQKSPRPRPQEVFRQLTASHLPRERGVLKSRDEVIQDERGNPLFRVKYQRDSIALVLCKRRLTAVSLEKLKAAVSQALAEVAPQNQMSSTETRARAGGPVEDARQQL